MNFEEQIKSFAKRSAILKEQITNEEATKTSLIMPFFQLLGYDVFNPKGELLYSKTVDFSTFCILHWHYVGILIFYLHKKTTCIGCFLISTLRRLKGILRFFTQYKILY